MVRDGVLPEKEVIGWRAADGEAFPTANTGEIVVFESFFYRGFSDPTSRFFRGLLHFYKIELVHLNPNSILHIAAFIHLCEAYLGIGPHFALFRYLFQVTTRQKSGPVVVGGASIQMRKQRFNKYITLPTRDSLKGWHCRWFYISNPNPALPAYIGRPLALEVSWNSFPSDEEMKDVRLLLVRLEAIKIVDQLSGVAVVRDFIERRIQPIKERHHPAYEDSGREDPTRESSSLWVPRVLEARTTSLFQTDVAVRDISLPKGYTLDHPPNRVSAFAEICLLLLSDQVYPSHLLCSGDVSHFCISSSSSRRGSVGRGGHRPIHPASSGRRRGGCQGSDHPASHPEEERKGGGRDGGEESQGIHPIADGWCLEDWRRG